MGEVKTYSRKHYSGLDADKANVTGSLGDSYAANDSGKQYYWNDSLNAWKTGLGYEYVPRSVAVEDFNQGDFTIDGAAHIDGLDLSGIVPAGAVAVQINLVVLGSAANKIGYFWANVTTKVENVVKLYTQVANIKVNEDSVLNIDPDRLVNYYFDATITVIEVRILGWFI